jgi:protein-L-isoaspartate(D-aspartate) O-methyltransferase
MSNYFKFLFLFAFCFCGISATCINKEMEVLTNNLKSRGFIKSDLVYSVYCSIDRKLFLRATDSSSGYIDSPMYIGYGATISAPHMHAYALETIYQRLRKLNYDKNQELKILDVGSGSGYLYI